jgi:ABC-type amino acid transport substrate-binding protein
MLKGTRARLVAGLVLAVATVGLAAGCGGGGGGGGGKYGLITDGVLTIGSDIPYPPFEQGKPPDYKGFDVDLVDEIAKRLDLTPKWVDTAFGTIFPDEQAGKFDMVASASTITNVRAKKVTFSDPYFDAGQSLMVQKGSSIQTVDDLTSSDSVGVQGGTTGQDYAEQHTDATVQQFATIGTAFNALNNGQVDAVINDYPVSLAAQEKYPQLEVVGPTLTGEHYGLAMQQGDTDLIDAVNGALKDIIADGTYQTFFEKWFPGKPPAAYQPSG